MKQLFYVILFLFLIITFGCDILCPGEYSDEPGPPYGTANNKNIYIGQNGYKTITYIYYCLSSKGNKYVSATYTRKTNCSSWEKTSEYTSNGICDD